MSSKPYAMGVDVGGTKIAAGLVDREGRILHRFYTKEHSGHPPDVVVESIVRACNAVLLESKVKREDVAGIGIGFGGHVNGRAGLVLTSSNMPAWDNMPLRDRVAELVGLPVALENDCNIVALAEYHHGAGRGCRDMVYITMSTGLGIGIIIDGKLYAGHTGTAGELGHTVVHADDRTCACGKRGCLMAYACGMGLQDMAADRIAAGEPTLLREMCEGSVERICGEMVHEAAQRGDKVAQELIWTLGHYLGIGLSTIVQVLNPEVIVVGGGLVRIGSAIMEPALEALRENVHPVLWDSAKVVLSQFWDDAGVIGGAEIAFENADAGAQ